MRSHIRTGILLSLLLTATAGFDTGHLNCLSPNVVTSISSIHYQGKGTPNVLIIMLGMQKFWVCC